MSVDYRPKAIGKSEIPVATEWVLKTSIGYHPNAFSEKWISVATAKRKKSQDQILFGKNLPNFQWMTEVWSFGDHHFHHYHSMITTLCPCSVLRRVTSEQVDVLNADRCCESMIDTSSEFLFCKVVFGSKSFDSLKQYSYACNPFC